MTTFVNNDVQSGNVIYASEHNEQGSRIAAVLNGGIDSNNLADNAVSTAKIADSNVTSAKIADANVTAAKLSTSAIKLGYSSTTTAQTSITTEVDATSLTATVTAPGSRDIEISGNLNIASSTGGALATIRLKEGSTLLRTWQFGVYNTANPNTVAYKHVISAPSAGSHTYKLTASFNASSQLYADNTTKFVNDLLVKAI